MKQSIELGNRKYFVNAYTTFQEKEILLSSSFEENNLDVILDILGFNDYSELTEDEKKVILYKHREISIGDEIDISFVCDNCKHPNQISVSASNFIEAPKRNDNDIKSFTKKFSEENISDYVSIDADELDIDEYDELVERIKDNQYTINFLKPATCISCRTQTHINIGNTKFVIEAMSEDTLMSLYKIYNSLVLFGNYSKIDIDSMYPFERKIFVGLLKSTKEEMAKQ
jgi:hypothetical protein